MRASLVLCPEFGHKTWERGRRMPAPPFPNPFPQCLGQLGF